MQQKRKMSNETVLQACGFKQAEVFIKCLLPLITIRGMLQQITYFSLRTGKRTARYADVSNDKIWYAIWLQPERFPFHNCKL